MSALVKLVCYITPKAIDLIKEYASSVWDTITGEDTLD